mmetsp:Transcript_12163/g.35227  ORF Transcript_12163/g.35227 Transcript_12163/m.35227 type:complete len:256 (-) Transcript_12163:1016-1783(-)
MQTSSRDLHSLQEGVQIQELFIRGVLVPHVHGMVELREGLKIFGINGKSHPAQSLNEGRSGYNPAGETRGGLPPQEPVQVEAAAPSGALLGDLRVQPSTEPFPAQRRQLSPILGSIARGLRGLGFRGAGEHEFFQLDVVHEAVAPGGEKFGDEVPVLVREITAEGVQSVHCDCRSDCATAPHVEALKRSPDCPALFLGLQCCVVDLSQDMPHPPPLLSESHSTIEATSTVEGDTAALQQWVSQCLEGDGAGRPRV